MSAHDSAVMPTSEQGQEAIRRHARWPRQGGVIMIAGPDGCGKTTLAQELASTWLAGAPVLLVHHRRGIGTLPGRRPRGPTTQPHRHAPYPAVVSLGKLLYLFADFMYGWRSTIRPYVRAGGWVILQRDWWDLLVDPQRYRLRPVRRLGRLLGRLLPEPDLTIVLDAEPRVVHARKAELPLEELARQRAAWREVRPPSPACVHLDASMSAEDVLERAANELTQRMEVRGGSRHASGWAALPPTREPRWLLPLGSRAVVRTGLDIHQPVTPRARIAREMARALSALGVARLLPAGAVPPQVVADLVAPFVPRGGTFAVARSNHIGRWSALVIAADGSPVAVAKVATDAEGRSALAREAANLERFGSLLPHPLAAPRLLGSGDGVLVMEAVRWRTRARPWKMPEAVAHALGVFYRAGTPGPGAGPDTGLSHGDAAPWNLLETHDGWVLVDWEDARANRRPFHDLAHHLAQSCTLLGRPTAREIFEGVAKGKGWVGAAVEAHALGAGRSSDEAWPRLLDYLHEHRDRSERRSLLVTLTGLGRADPRFTG